MGVELADGSLSVHAHNTYLQVIYDHGLITGAVYLILGAVSLMQMFRYAYWAGRKKREDSADPYAALPLAIFLAFAWRAGGMAVPSLQPIGLFHHGSTGAAAYIPQRKESVE